MRRLTCLAPLFIVLVVTMARADRILIVDPRHPQAADINAGSAEAPFKTISAAANIVEPGDTVLIRSGTYRERVQIERGGTADKPVVFRADLAANVVVTGADVLDKLQEEPGEDRIYSVPWPHVFIGWNPTRTHPADDYHALVGRAEQVFVNGYPLRQVLCGRERPPREQLSRGTFLVDEPGKRLYVWGFHNEDLAKQLVEASTRDLLWEVKAPYVHTRGLRFRYAANMAQHGAVALSGQGDVLEDCVCERMNSIGATFAGPGLTVRRCVFQDNGQMGFSAGGAHNLLFTGCLVRNNNTKGWNRGWEAGGDKLCMSRGVVIEQSQFLDNRGNGIWFDIGNEDCTVRNCLIADNEDGGIFYEISYGLHAHDNVIIGNGFALTPGAWGAQAAISLSSSPGCLIERNLMIGNKEGFNFREQGRTTPRIGKQGAEEPVWNNVLAYNRDAQTWGWFDVLDERHFPAALQRKPADLKQGAPVGKLGQMALDEKGWPVNVALDQMSLTFENNLYAAAAGQGLLNWGCAWRHNERYPNLAKVRQDLNLEQNSRLADFAFADYLTRDFRVPADSPAVAMKCYPQGDVPGVRLGVLPAAQ
jgi:hypothetical protein